MSLFNGKRRYPWNQNEKEEKNGYGTDSMKFFDILKLTKIDSTYFVGMEI